MANPEPAIGFLQECVRWWDQWLKGIDTGVKNDPKLITYIQESEKPQVYYEERPGKWVTEQSWPSSNVTNESLWLTEGKLVTSPVNEDVELLVPSVQEHGFYAGVFCPFGQPGDLPADQRYENGNAVVFTSEPLEKEIELLGHPVFHAELSADQENAFIAVRLMDKAPTGESTLISWGMLNLNHLKSHEYPEALVPGKKYQVRVELNPLGQKIPKGHRLEVAVSPTYWPQSWPSPKPVTLTLYAGEDTHISLPVRPPQPDDGEVTFDIPEIAEPIKQKVLREGERTRDVQHNMTDGTWKLIDVSDEGERILLPNGMQYGSINRNTYTIKENDPLSAHVQCEWDMVVGRGDWQVKLKTNSEMSSDETTYYLVNTLTAYEGDQEVFTKTWKAEIPRDFT